MEDMLDVLLPILGFAFYAFIKYKGASVKQNKKSPPIINKSAVPKQDIVYERDISKQKINVPLTEETNDFEKQTLFMQYKDKKNNPVEGKVYETTNNKLEIESNDDEIVKITSDSVLNGIILSEVLGRPVSKR